ncbi:uncharacterized protein LOC117644098 isoform X2 [Thrips palmi]|uniref:Uncharacterized protein LOC117644098 isoform X2 n=1 Tax=Thrips palmi TaxID=161013 RepID=A0A6P8ZLP0_THRPL|nr:uncharacterized protein LOC117644098 isoform X2 [Thrips palmi]
MSGLAANYYYLQAEPGYSLKILVHPNPLYRLRYVKEMTSFHGALKGFNAPYPKVQLQHPTLTEDESETETFIRASVFTASCEPHVHRIVTKESGTTNWGLRYYTDINVSSQNDFQAEFRNLIIIRRNKSEWIEEEVTRLKNECMCTDLPIPVEEFTNQAQEAWKRLQTELRQFRLGFYAYKRGCPTPLCGPLFSSVISNQEEAPPERKGGRGVVMAFPASLPVDANVGKLQIDRMSAYSGKSGDELILLVSKIAQKSQVKARFFEGDPDTPSWEEYAQEVHLHHQVALIVSVPPYREDIKAEVQVQLERTKSDGSKSRSEARNFSYRPSKLSGKRRLSTSPNCNSLGNERRSRTIGGSFSEENIQVQREEQQLNAVQSCPNVNWQNQGSDLQTFLVEGSSSSQNIHQQLAECYLSDSQGLDGSSVVAESFEPNNQQYSGLQMAGLPEFPSFGPNNQGAEALLDPLPAELDVFSWNVFLPSANAWSNVTWGVDLVADSTDEKKKTTGKETHNVVTDGVGKINVCRSKSLEHNKDMSCSSAPIQQAQACIRLFQFAMTGNAKELEKLLKCMTTMQKRRWINETNGQEQTPLIIAVEQNHNECVKLLCLAGANVNLADEEENTSYHIAAKKNYNKCLETLLKVEDRELDKKNIKGEAALHLAVLSNNVKSVALLIAAGANVNEKNCTAGSTPLHLAVQYGYTELVHHLLEQKNIKIDEVNYADKTAAGVVKADQRIIINLFKELQGFAVTIEEETTDEDE